ncbi:M48 family metallopeptidase [Leeuwenhoekiella aequorea]|uniref:Peptidase M48-like protein n=1 Tax=Leeuwenhoekiella aequorea TaxID=283736 RepID=A0A4Q0PAM3_9FLAO|nr:M48 family metallopeptidase [Leeuwenhoekiella aequorea]RXG23813.1 peptidase M48-like protein [Leeuwenhoekiella aequorea]
MKSRSILLALVTVLLVVSCKTSPFTGKQTLNRYDNSTLFPMAFQQYDAFLKENKVVSNTSEAQMVQRVGSNIAKAAERYMTALGYPNYLDDYRWEYNLVQDEAINAFCMPGGKIVVYTGILPVAQDEAGLAMILGHELAHALANHGGQRMTAGEAQSVVGAVGGLALGDSKSGQLFNQYYGTASNIVGILPFSRSHESEADEIGTIIAAIAGYDPYEAPKLWERMKAQGSSGTPEILSTHPSPDTRIQALTTIAPRAAAEAKKFGVTSFK